VLALKTLKTLKTALELGQEGRRRGHRPGVLAIELMPMISVEDDDSERTRVGDWRRWLEAGPERQFCLGRPRGRLPEDRPAAGCRQPAGERATA